MIFKFKISFSSRDEWIGWFGENVIKLRLNTDIKNLEHDFIKFLNIDLGIKNSDIKILQKEVQRRTFTLELPDIAWELFLGIIEK
jgi:hypothetical protein